jgi:hypothetical protein
MKGSKTEPSAVIPFPGPAANAPRHSRAAAYQAVRFNALKHGVLSRHTVLAHEDQGEFAKLIVGLMKEHRPVGPTESHLVEELAGVMWRKRRVLMAEGAAINRSMSVTVRNAPATMQAAAPFEAGMTGEPADVRTFMRMSPGRISELQQESLEDLYATMKATATLRRGGVRTYAKALKQLAPGVGRCFDDLVAADVYRPDEDGLAKFIAEIVRPEVELAELQARNAEAVKAQVQGEGLPVDRLESMCRYESHLDRKFERTLGMLIKLQDIRRGR